MVCQGNKVSGDTCDLDSECLTTYCDVTTKTCNSLPALELKWNYVTIIAFLFGAIVFVVVVSYCCLVWKVRRSSYTNDSVKYDERENRYRNHHIQGD